MSSLFVLVGVMAGWALSKRHQRSSPMTLNNINPSLRPPSTKAVVIEAMTTETLVNRTLETFAIGYMTILAIVQGVAFVILASNALPLVFHTDSGAEVLRVTGQCTSQFAAIIIVSYEYIGLTNIMLRWAPTFLDMLIPFMLGIGEILPSLRLTELVSWWILMAFMMILCIGALSHSIYRSSPEMFPEVRSAFQGIRGLLRRLILCSLSIMVLCLLFALLSALNVTSWVLDVAPWTPLVIGCVAVAFNERCLGSVYKAYGVPRWRRG